MAKKSVINELVKVYAEATKEIIEANTGSAISFSKTALKIPQVYLKPDIGCFVELTGDFEGLIIMNFSKEAALEIYKKYMTLIGMPEDEIAENYTSKEVADSIGEIVNQIAGKARQTFEKNFGIVVKINQPKAIVISSTIMMSIAADIVKPQNRRISFRTESKNPFYAEISIEQTEFVNLFNGTNAEEEEEELDIDKLLEMNQ